jgi:ubiquinone/menaquinone biosynthesis C-methylase UbiE
VIYALAVTERQANEDLARREFWGENQPGFRFTSEPVGSPAFFADVERHRYELEPAIPAKARFADWAGRDVLEAGCGIATDGLNFARCGARYTGVDFSRSAIELARRRFEMEGVAGRIIPGSVTQLPVQDRSQDLVYSNGVIHHIPDTQRVVNEMYRVLRPGGRAIVMIYHRASLNYHVNIMLVRRALVLALMAPGVGDLVARATGEAPELLKGHQRLLREHGLRYLADRQLFLNNNTDGPGNPLSKVTSRSDVRRLFARFTNVETDARYLNLRLYPRGQWLAQTALARRLERRYGWHLWIEALR